MKLLLLHGPGVTSSRIKLTNFKKEFNEEDSIVFEDGVDLSQLKDSLTTLPLLSDQRLVILENPPEDTILDLSVPTPSGSLNLILWFDHEVSDKKKVMQWVKKNGQVLYFPEGREISIFPFLDCLANKEKRAFSEANKLKIAGYDFYYLITMVFYLLRSLVVSPKSSPQFVKNKLLKQRANFSRKDLESLYKSMLDLDFKIKKGLMETSQAEFSLINKFIG